MTLRDFIRSMNISRDADKMLIWSDGIGWSNVEIEVGETEIRILPSKSNSPFSSDN